LVQQAVSQDIDEGVHYVSSEGYPIQPARFITPERYRTSEHCDTQAAWKASQHRLHINVAFNSSRLGSELFLLRRATER
jgi:hypothetical protein